ncbi:MAG: hypothetical protein ACLQVD_17565 [Capsulimonadaceae bacterium]
MSRRLFDLRLFVVVAFVSVVLIPVSVQAQSQQTATVSVSEGLKSSVDKQLSDLMMMVVATGNQPTASNETFNMTVSIGGQQLTFNSDGTQSASVQVNPQQNQVSYSFGGSASVNCTATNSRTGQQKQVTESWNFSGSNQITVSRQEAGTTIPCTVIVQSNFITSADPAGGSSTTSYVLALVRNPCFIPPSSIVLSSSNCNPLVAGNAIGSAVAVTVAPQNRYWGTVSMSTATKDANGNPVAGLQVSLDKSQLTFSSPDAAANQTCTATITAPAGLAAGNYTVSVTGTDSVDPSITSSTSANVTVTAR